MSANDIVINQRLASLSNTVTVLRRTSQGSVPSLVNFYLFAPGGQLFVLKAHIFHFPKQGLPSRTGGPLPVGDGPAISEVRRDAIVRAPNGGNPFGHDPREIDFSTTGGYVVVFGGHMFHQQSCVRTKALLKRNRRWSRSRKLH